MPQRRRSSKPALLCAAAALMAFLAAAPCAPAETARAAFLDAKGRPGCEFQAEVMRTPEEKARGLMFRKELKPESGMLFVFDRDETQTFWMANTYIPLDIIFISSPGRVVDVHQNARPLDRSTIVSKAPARYVLEVNAGYAKHCGIARGVRVRFTGSRFP